MTAEQWAMTVVCGSVLLYPAWRALRWIVAAAWAANDRAIDRRVDRALTSPKYAAATDDPYALMPLSERTERGNQIAAETRAAFEDTLAGRPHLAAIRARQEAAAFDPEAADWNERTGR